MVEIELDTRKSIEENAAVYFDKAKKLKKKLKGTEEALENSKEKLKKLEKKEEKETKIKAVKEEEKKQKESRKKQWYEKFRWFISSEGFLCIGGRDATTNEIVIKKHTDKDDIVFHTKMAGSPFFVIKTAGKKPDKITLEETAAATLTFSRAWKLNIITADVFYVNPEQVSKTPKSGEYLEKGAFIITGKMNIINPLIDLAIGILPDKSIMAGPVSAIKKNCEKYIELKQGKEKAGQIAKKIRARIGGDLDDIIRVLPSGEFEVKR